MPDVLQIKIKYFLVFGKKINLRHPQTFNEKIQWLKLYDRKLEYTNMVDKYEAKRYVASIIGEKHIIPTLGVWDNFDDIDFDDTLPEQFVLKATHFSGGVYICKDRESFDIKKIKKDMNKILKHNFYWSGRESPYKNIKPRIIAEKYMVDESGVELKDYKIQCFNGDPKIIQVDFDRFSECHKRNFYSIDWLYQPFSLSYPTYPEIMIEKPESLDLMLALAKELSRDILYVRVDFYSIRKKIYFGELTFYHGSGYEKFDPSEWNSVFGNWLVLPPPPPPV
ncbi:MAG: hypothetical protein LBK43_10625 [Treponema sp.]|nr:hypothetical protein [Treponema sp.]